MKKILLMFLAVAMLVSSVPMSVMAEETTILYEGVEDNISWTIDSEGVLRVSGTGNMRDFAPTHAMRYDVPWGWYWDKVSSVVIEEGITKIGTNAFMDCKNVTEVTLPKGLTYIGPAAFYACRLIETIAFPEGLEEIASNAFTYCSSLKSVEFPSTLKNIWYGAFSYCSSLESIKLHEGVLSIKTGAFLSCDMLSDIYYEGIERVWKQVSIEDGNDALYNATVHFSKEEPPFLAEGTCGDNLTWTLDEEGTLRIDGEGEMIDFGTNGRGPWSISYAEKIKSVVLSRGITRVGAGAFRDCKNLKTVQLPDGITQIGEKAFLSCESLESIEIPEGVKIIGADAFSRCYKLTKINLPESLMYLKERAFEFCWALQDVELPQRIGEIEERTFRQCYALNSIVLPSGLQSIGSMAFASAGLKKVTFQRTATMPSISSDAGLFSSGLTRIYVPAVAYDKYVSAFSNKVHANTKILRIGQVWTKPRAEAIVTRTDSYGELTIDDDKVTLTVTGEVPLSKNAAGVWANWIGFNVVLPDGLDANEVTITRPDGVQLKFTDIQDSTDPAMAILYNGALPTTTSLVREYKIDWNGDRFEDLIFVIDLTNAKLDNGSFKVAWEYWGGHGYQYYGYGQLPTLYAPDGEDAYNTYLFTGWDKEIVPVTNDVTYTAQYTTVPKSHTSAIKARTDSYGELSVSDNVVTLHVTGKVPFEKNGAGVEANWIGFEIEAPKGIDATKVIITRPDGVQLNLDAIKDATNPTKAILYNGAVPSTTTLIREYKIDWNGDGEHELSFVIDLTQAKLLKKAYKVTWINFDGTILETETYYEGDVPEYKGEVPTFENANFKGWGPTISEVTGDASYIAQFDYSGIAWFTEDGEKVAYYYEDGKVKKNAGVVQVGDYLYYVLYSGKIATGTNRTIKADKTNGLVEEGTYYFYQNGVLETEDIRLSGEIRWRDENGKRIGEYYVQDELRKDVGLVELWNEEAGETCWYYVLYSGRIKSNYAADGKRVNQSIVASKLNRYTGEAGTYSFYENGVMYDPYATEAGIVKYDETGKPFYYVDGFIRKDAGLVYITRGDLAGNYVFVTYSGTLKKGTQTVKETNCNGHLEFVGKQKFDDATGAMIIK